MSSRPFRTAVFVPVVALAAAASAACSYHDGRAPSVDAAATDARPADTGAVDTAADARAVDTAADAGPDVPAEDALADTPTADLPSEAAPVPPTAEQLAFGCPPDAELRGCWAFDEPGPMLDGSGGNNHVMRNSAQWVNDGVRGGALRFTTGRQFAVIPDSASLRLAGSDATFEAWIRPSMSTADGGADTIASKFTSGFTGWSFCGYDHQVRLYTTGTTNQAAGTFADRSWAHVAIVLRRDGVDVYLDGIKRNPMPLAPLTITANQESITIGGLDPANLGTLPPERFAFHGDIDVLRIYGRPRRPEEICAAAGRSFVSGSCRPGSAPAP
jgi:Concanavalin A-like lectin/glucanases superfamily